jgi:hypothetical protein
MSTTHGPAPAERPLPMYAVQVYRRGKVYHYFRYKGLYRRLPDERTSDDFKREYAKAFALDLASGRETTARHPRSY